MLVEHCLGSVVCHRWTGWFVVFAYAANCLYLLPYASLYQRAASCMAGSVIPRRAPLRRTELQLWAIVIVQLR